MWLVNMQEALTFNHGYEHKTKKLLLNNAFILRFLTLHEKTCIRARIQPHTPLVIGHTLAYTACNTGSQMWLIHTHPPRGWHGTPLALQRSVAIVNNSMVACRGALAFHTLTIILIQDWWFCPHWSYSHWWMCIGGSHCHWWMCMGGWVIQYAYSKYIIYNVIYVLMYL